jgi:glycosyltransferase involved in cell wall biosynthesis/GT2 family glycosyltransferase
VSRILIICPDKTGPLMAGTAIRSVEIARALAHDCEVTLAVPEGSEPVAVDVAQVRVPSDSTLPPLLAAADCVMISGRAELMTAIRKPLIVDLYDPFILSDLEFYGGRFNAAGGRPLLALRWLQHHLENGDLFLCASEVQRSFWLGMLAAAGRVNRANYAGDRAFDELLAVVPFGIASTPPVRTKPAVKGVIPGIGVDDKVVLWAGGLWNWFDPLTLLEALARLRARRPEVKGLFLGVRHPNPDIGSMEMADRALERARTLGLLDRGAFFVDWVPYAERQNYLLDADIAVSLHQPGVEAQFAFRTRVLDYFWAGLPMVLSRGDELAARVDREGLGVTVPEGDVDAVAGALERLLDAEPSAARQARFAALQDELSWTRVIEPVRRFCRAPHQAADKVEGAWFDAQAPRETIVHKEDALIAEEWLTTEREISPPLGRYFALEHRFVAAYDNLCRVDVLPWITAPPPLADVIFSLYEDRPRGARVARVVAPLRALPHDGWQRFEFRPIPNSRGRSYRVTIEAPTTIDSGVALWLCKPAGASEPTPALAAHYLVKGVVDALPLDDESFLFLHNTTVSDTLVPGVAAFAARGDDFASSLLPADGAPQPQAPTPPTDAGRAADALRGDVARLAAELAVTRQEMAALAAAQATAGADVRVLPKLVRELAHVFGRVAFRLRVLAAFLVTVTLTIASLPLALALALMLIAADLVARLGRRPDARAAAAAPLAAARSTLPVSIVIPTWNGRELLQMSLPPLRAALAAHPPGGEIIVVDNGSADDTRAWVTAEFPEVRLIALPTNEGFAGATNRGARDSRHPTLILLNNDMVVEPDFILPLLRAMDEEPTAFGVSCQIDFIDKGKPRWETGKVHARWKWGTITLFHLDRWQDDNLYPIFFAGGGASAYDRAKFLALEGFDEAVFSPVYIEDVELGYRAWKRGWPSLFAPKSLVHHKHRGTTRRIWSEDKIYSFFVTNLAALVWKNVTDWRLLRTHLAGIVLLPFRVRSQSGVKAAAYTWIGMWKQLPVVARARVREGRLARTFDDATIFAISRHRYVFRGRQGRRPPRHAHARLRVLIASPYSPYPPVHGGAVRMLSLLRRLSQVADVTWVAYADTQPELDPRSTAELQRLCREVVVIERDTTAVGGILLPNKTRGFCSHLMEQQLEYFLDRDDYDVLQLEYTHLAHLMPPPSPGLLRVLVEHDVSFVSLARSQATAAGRLARVGFWFDWMRMLRYELAAVENADLVLTMSETDRDILGRYVDTRHVVPIPNGVDCRAFPFTETGRTPASILFVGFFRHEPNVEAVRYFCGNVLPRVRAAVPEVRFRVVGAYPPEIVRRLGDDPGVEVTGRVEDIIPYYRESAVFVAPVLQGSGTRLKILEAMASGCPVVSTTIGAEGLGATDGAELLIADSAEAMADAIVRLLRDPATSTALARRARAFVEARFDWDGIAARLVTTYEAALGALPAAPTEPR